MKAVCALLLLVAYVSANFDECDPLAADTFKKPDAKEGDQWISLKTFSSVKKAHYFASHATESSLPNANKYCNVASHGKDCGAVEYSREITAGPQDPNSDVGADELEFKTVFVGVDENETEAVEYHMVMKGINKDDYIIQADKNVKIRAVRIHANGQRENIEEKDIPNDIVGALRQPYGLFHSEPGSFTVYSTCDGTTVWVSYTAEAIAQGKHLGEVPALKKVLANLEARAKVIRKKAGKENEEPKLRGIPTAIKNKEFNKGIPVA